MFSRYIFLAKSWLYSGRTKGTLLLALIAVFAIVLSLQRIPGLQTIELSYEDYLRSGADLTPDSNAIAVVGIDTRSITIVGEWPWDHGKISDLLVTICDCKPRAVMLEFPLAERMEEFLAGTSGQLATSIRECGNVIIPFDVVVASKGKLSRSAPSYFKEFAISHGRSQFSNRVPVAAAAFVPPEIFSTKARGIGFNYCDVDSDERVRRASLLVNYEGAVYPSAQLELASAYLGNQTGAIRLDDESRLWLGNRRLPLDERGTMLLRFPREGRLYPAFSAIDVLTGSVDHSALHDKAVIVAATNPTQSIYLETATSGEVATHTYSAAIVQQLISNATDVPSMLPTWAVTLLLVVLSLSAALFLPRLSLTQRLISLMAAAVLVSASGLLLFEAFSMIVPIVYPLLALFLFAIVTPFVRVSDESSSYATAHASSGKKREHTGEPVAIDRDSDEEITASELPKRVLKEAKSAPEAYSETVRLDFEAMSKGMGGRDHLSDAAEPDKPIDIDLSSDANADKKEKKKHDFESTRVISADLLLNKEEPESGAIVKPAKQSATTTTGDALDIDAPLGDTDPSPMEIDKGDAEPAAAGQPISFGRYLAIEPVGSGAMGTVYKGRDPAIDRSVALKTIRFDAIADRSEAGELKERLIREAKAAGNLSHPNIVTIYDVGIQGELQYIAMEYIDGYTLEALLKRNLELNYRIIAEITKQVCSALEYAHGSGIVHRDIKPANIMVMDSFQVKVMDFGIAHFQSSSMTQTGVAMGTPSYISPELLQGHEVTPATDIYSLGVVLYELLTRRKPFTAENISSLVYKIVHEQPEAPTSLDPKIPSLFDHIIKKSLAKKPQDRYGTAKEFAKALEDFTFSIKRKPAMV